MRAFQRDFCLPPVTDPQQHHINHATENNNLRLVHTHKHYSPPSAAQQVTSTLIANLTQTITNQYSTFQKNCEQEPELKFYLIDTIMKCNELML